MNKLKKEVSSFFLFVSKSNETLYLILFTLYVLVFFELKVVWQSNISHLVDNIRYALLGIIMWGAAVYLFFIIVSWKKLWNHSFWMVLIGACIIAATAFFSRIMSTNSYGVVFDVYFCLLACGKSFRKMLKCILGVAVSMLLIAGIGVPAHYTFDLGKPDVSFPGHSLGIDYPNTWAYLVFLALMILWYLYLRNKPVITFIIFWACSVFNYYYITCRTIAVVTLAFPFIALFVDRLEAHADKKADDGTFKRIRPLEWLVTVIPLLCFAFMLIVSLQVEWVHKFYHGPLRNLAWRFLMGGLYFRTYGFPIVGNPYRSNVQKFVNVNGEFIEVGILDSSFAAYIIMRGMIWMTYTLLWLCLAHWKALKKRDYAIIFLETIILFFAMMERPGLEMWYNFVLLYPLAKVISKPGTEPVLEFTEEAGAEKSPVETDGDEIPVESTDSEFDSVSELESFETKDVDKEDDITEE